MKTNTMKRIECAWLLRDFAWSLKRLADRYERCCTENPSDHNEAQAQVWVERAKERLAKFRASRREYMGGKNPIEAVTDSFIEYISNFDMRPKRNPWRAGNPPDTYVGNIVLFYASGNQTMLQRLDLCRGTGPMLICHAWRPA
jgi:hypothetical protein